jgi:hypothetical protein
VRRDKIPTEVEIAMLTGAPYNPEQPKEIAFRHTIFDPTRHLPKDDVRRTFQQLQVFPLAMLKNQTTRPNELAMFRREGEGPLVVPPFDASSAYAAAKGMLPFSWQVNPEDFLSTERTPTADSRQLTGGLSGRMSERSRYYYQHQQQQQQQQQQTDVDRLPTSRADVLKAKKKKQKRPALSLGKPEPTNFEKKALREKKALEESIRLSRRLRLLESHLENMPDEVAVKKKTDYSQIGKLEVQPWRSGGSTAPEWKRRPNDFKQNHEQAPPDPYKFRGFLDRTYVPANVTSNKR